MSKRFLIPIVIIAIAIGFFGGFYYAQGGTLRENLGTLINQATGKPSNIDFGLFWSVWDNIQSSYVDKDKLKTQDLVYGAINGLVDSIGDPYTAFFEPKETEEFAGEIQGTFGGVGIEIGIRKDMLTVIAPIKDTPAYRAGILAQDKIVRINDEVTDGMKVNEAVSLIRGPRGTSVRLTIMRDSLKEPKEFTMVRDNIKVPTVSWKMLEGNVAYLQLYIFNQNVDSEFKKVAKEIVDSGAKKIILDVRNNPGGLLDSSVNIAGYFLDSNSPVTIERFGNKTETIYRTKDNATLKNYPLIVVINKGSASASEILAGALRDNRRVTLIGETSFGKGSVQQVVGLSGGTSLKITIAKWFTPNGTSINEDGLKPDVEVKRSDEDIQEDRDPQLDKAVELITSL